MFKFFGGFFLNKVESIFFNYFSFYVGVFYRLLFFGWVVLFLKLKMFSLLVSCPRGRERDAASELWYVLTSDLGEDDVNVEVTEVPGLIGAFSSSSPFSVISRLRKMLEEGSLNLSLCSKFKSRKTLSFTVQGICCVLPA